MNEREVWTALSPHLRKTTFIESERLDAEVGARVLLASETFQHTGSFKMRAAMAVALASSAPRLLTASSGNFGAALARAAARSGKGCTVVMPARAAAVKIAAVQRFGATVDLIDTDRVTRNARLAELAAADPAAEAVSPFDDDRVIAGNASLGAELFAREVPECVLVPVGGGGLSSGMVVARDRLALRCEVLGAEPLTANDAARSLAGGVLVANAREPDTLADGARTLSLGQRNWAILRGGLGGIVEVPEEAIARAVRLLYDTANLKAEPTGALALGALLAAPARFAGRRVACIVSGGNVDGALYARLVG